MKYNCLIIDDEKELAEATNEYLNMFGVTSAFCLNADDCLKFLKNNSVDLLLLDINLGSDSGFTLCKKIREKFNMPILFISARTSDDDVLIALNIGGDDYIKKPYSLSVLLAKVKAILKRYGTNEQKKIYDCDGIKVDYSSGKVTSCSKEILLNPMEYKLLVYLIDNKGKIISKEELFLNIWGDKFTQDGTLNVHIRHIREKLEDDPNNPKHIKTVWGRGYIFE